MHAPTYPLHKDKQARTNSIYSSNDASMLRVHKTIVLFCTLHTCTRENHMKQIIVKSNYDRRSGVTFVVYYFDKIYSVVNQTQ